MPNKDWDDCVGFESHKCNSCRNVDVNPFILLGEYPIDIDLGQRFPQFEVPRDIVGRL